MRNIILSILGLLLFSGFDDMHEKRDAADFTCTLSSDKMIYKLGEVPKLDVRVINETLQPAYLVGSLDGSDLKWRMPYCYFTIDKPKPDTVVFLRCGNSNPIREIEIKLIKPKEKFNPYEPIDNYGFFGDHASMQKETFRNPGVYKIQFHYSTNTQDTRNFIGNFGIWTADADSVKLKELLRRVPRIDLVSNPIEITIGE
ncbi:MAG: hypothetical protein V4539_18955 [Bacteroidota bacterium]